MLENVSTGELFSVCAQLEAAHETDEVMSAKQKLNDWHIDFQDAINELVAREQMIKERKDKIQANTEVLDRKADIEKICRLICQAENVNPDVESLGSGGVIEKNKPYKLWQARIRVAETLLDSGLAFPCV